MIIKNYFCLSILVALVGCGGGNGDESVMTTSSTVRTLASATSAAAVTADYTTTVQQLYVAYFGRPADPSGLANFSAALVATEVTPDIQALDSAYRSNRAITALIDNFGVSEESKALYNGVTTSDFVNTIYRNVLGRDADISGLLFWTKAISDGTLTQAHASFSIMAGALANTSSQGIQDAALINNRLAVATAFTTALENSATTGAYSGNQAAATARTMLNGVTASTNPTSFQTLVTNTIGILTGAAPVSPHPTDPGTAPNQPVAEKYIGVAYLTRNGLSVTLNSVDIVDLGNGYMHYTVSYTQRNNTTFAIDEGALKLYFSNDVAIPQYGFFNRVLPGDQYEVTRAYTFEFLKDKFPMALEYDHDNFFAKTPVVGSLQWKFPISAQK